MIKQDRSILSWTAHILGHKVELNASFELLDKVKAQDILSRPFGNQRSINKANLDRITQAMNADEYIDAVINPIFISDTGKLLDGQHRLQALTRTNKEILFLVVRGLPEATFVYIDQNKSRAAKDAMKVRGIRNADKVSSTTKLIYQLMEGKSSVPRNEVLDRMVEDYPDMEDAVARAESMTDTTHIVSSVGGALHFLYAREYPDVYEKFFDLLQYGGDEFKNKQHPVGRLKSKLHNDWLAYRNGDRVRIYDHRWQQMAYIHISFMAYATKKHSFDWDGTQMAIDTVGQLCRKHVVVRETYIPGQFYTI